MKSTRSTKKTKKEKQKPFKTPKTQALTRRVTKMDRLANVLNRAVNSNAVANTLLVSVFCALAGRSVLQERTIEALEAEKEALLKSNKSIKRTIWDWKQKLYAEAESNPIDTPVPLSTLKSIYGDVVTPPSPVISGEDNKQEGKNSAPIMV